MVIVLFRQRNLCKLDIGAWVSILNQSGASYPEAKLKLIAGDVQRAQPQGQILAAPAARALAMEDRAAGFAEKAFFEYHLYTLGRATTLPDNSTKQIKLFPVARSVPCEKTLVYYGLAPGYGYGGSPITDRNYGIQSNKKVDVYLGFKNAQANNMGMPLPAGRIHVSKLDDADKTLEFIGEDIIDHTPKNEPVAVTVKENLYRWTNWQITAKNHDFEKQDARTIHFPVKIAAGGETVVRYTVQYTW